MGHSLLGRSLSHPLSSLKRLPGHQSTSSVYSQFVLWRKYLLVILIPNPSPHIRVNFCLPLLPTPHINFRTFQ